jgi:hypothetical protein
VEAMIARNEASLAVINIWALESHSNFGYVYEDDQRVL